MFKENTSREVKQLIWDQLETEMVQSLLCSVIKANDRDGFETFLKSQSYEQRINGKPDCSTKTGKITGIREPLWALNACTHALNTSLLPVEGMYLTWKKSSAIHSSIRDLVYETCEDDLKYWSQNHGNDESRVICYHQAIFLTNFLGSAIGYKPLVDLSNKFHLVDKYPEYSPFHNNNFVEIFDFELRSRTVMDTRLASVLNNQIDYLKSLPDGDFSGMDEEDLAAIIEKMKDYVHPDSAKELMRLYAPPGHDWNASSVFSEDCLTAFVENIINGHWRDLLPYLAEHGKSILHQAVDHDLVNSVGDFMVMFGAFHRLDEQEQQKYIENLDLGQKTIRDNASKAKYIGLEIHGFQEFIEGAQNKNRKCVDDAQLSILALLDAVPAEMSNKVMHSYVRMEEGSYSFLSNISMREGWSLVLDRLMDGGVDAKTLVDRSHLDPFIEDEMRSLVLAKSAKKMADQTLAELGLGSSPKP